MSFARLRRWGHVFSLVEIVSNDLLVGRELVPSSSYDARAVVLVGSS